MKKENSKKTLKIYVAGKLNGNAVDYIKNLHKMIVEAEKVRKAGFSVFVPGIDFLMGVVVGNYEYEDYFNNSQPWLEVADALYVLNYWETSEGTKKEIEKAKSLNKPIFYNLEDLINYRDGQDKDS